jgi:hypothetical protein
MPARLDNALANWDRALVNLRRRLFRKTPESEQEVVTQPGHVSVAKRVDDRPVAPTVKSESLNDSEFIRTQSQLMQTMLKAMIVASGWSADGSARGNDRKPEH